MEELSPYNHALALHDTAERMLVTSPALGDANDQFLRLTVAPGVYEHFKSTPTSRKYYAVFGVSRDVNESREPQNGNPFPYRVAYMALYPPHQLKFASRELLGPDGFLMPIDRENYTGPRFHLVEACDLSALMLRASTYLT